MIYPQTISAVDPVSLATVSGATKIRRFSAPTPPVVRPHLLTNQLRGCCAECASGGMALPPDYGTLAGLGQIPGFDPNSIDVNNLAVPSQGTGNISVLQTAAIGTAFIPGIGPIAAPVIANVGQMIAKIQAWLGIGAGRREANIIVPVQNQMMAVLGGITNQILMGATPDLGTLSALYRQVWAQGVSFQEFVLLHNFTDRRASGQALNTVMPYIDGSCGYAVPIGFTATPSQFNCLTWGDGTIGGPGQNGMLGAIGRAIQNAGGTIPTLTDVHQAANAGIKPTQIVTSPTGGPFGLPATIMGISTPLVLLGVGALYLYSKGSL